MKVFEAQITNEIINYFKSRRNLTFDEFNSDIHSISGIIDFFQNESELAELYEKISDFQSIVEEPDRAEYGDFQTNLPLAIKVCKLLENKQISPEVVIEPTCGKGNFIIAAVQNFENIREIYGIEIYKPYVWQTKFNILDLFIKGKEKSKPQIKIINDNIFDFNFKKHFKIETDNLLILGNPPWVTNSMLSSLNSKNLPQKTNFKNHNGLDAITGKGNFDIGEYITCSLLDNFSNQNGNLAFLVKNIVIKNCVYEQKKTKRPIAQIEKHIIKAKEEFNVSVDASLFFCKLNSEPNLICAEFDFYSQNQKQRFGWIENKFVSNLFTYQKTSYIDGKSPFVWRQGVKHDASKVMELERSNGHFVNNQKEMVELEEDLVYGLLKSSDLKTLTVNKTRKYTIITQKKVGQETKYISESYPKTYSYLTKNIEFFKRRKSSIYNGKPQFSIFGIGDYSFKPFKVAISGMYKDTTFSLVTPQNNKTIMLDDTCYFIGFENKDYAVLTQILLNKQEAQDFIQSISFEDSKRKITKDLLMRIDLYNIVQKIKYTEISAIDDSISKETWTNYLQDIKHKKEPINLFDLMKI